MASYRTHVLFGLLSSFFFYYFLRELFKVSFPLILLSLFFVYLGSIFPDLDHSGSKIHRDVVSFIVVLVMIVIGIFLFPPEIDIRGLTYYGIYVFSSGLIAYLLLTSLKPKHRGKIHSLKFGTFLSLLIGTSTLILLNSLIPGIFFFISFSSHLLIDRFS